MDIRINHRDMTPAQKIAFILAVLKLKNEVDSVVLPGKQKRYDDFVQVHKNAMLGPDMFMPMPHRGPLFYPWHRIFLKQFELSLQAAANDNSIIIPYWDWTITGANNPFTIDFLGGDGDKAQGQRVTTGPFAYTTGRFEIRVWDHDNGDPGLRRDLGEEPGSNLPTAGDVTSALARIPYSPGPGAWETVSEGFLHNPVHNWINGNMADATSPNDPVFFLHHCYLDLLWERWKLQHPTTAPYLPQTGGHGLDLQSTLVFSAPGKVAPWAKTWKVQDCITTQALDYQYV